MAGCCTALAARCCCCSALRTSVVNTLTVLALFPIHQVDTHQSSCVHSGRTIARQSRENGWIADHGISQMRVERCDFSGYKIYPSKGKTYVRGDSKVGYVVTFPG